MRRKSWIAGTVLLCVLAAACGRNKGDVVVIVKQGGGGTVKGQNVTFERDASGRMVPKIWVPGNVVIFRADETARGHTGKAGHAYQIQQDLSLKEIGQVDLSKDDDQLSEEFLKNPPKR